MDIKELVRQGCEALADNSEISKVGVDFTNGADFQFFLVGDYYGRVASLFHCAIER
jgi:hypothetical protein